jgi:hypothetical protein
MHNFMAGHRHSHHRPSTHRPHTLCLNRLRPAFHRDCQTLIAVTTSPGDSSRVPFKSSVSRRATCRYAASARRIGWSLWSEAATLAGAVVSALPPKSCRRCCRPVRLPWAISDILHCNRTMRFDGRRLNQKVHFSRVDPFVARSITDAFVREQMHSRPLSAVPK